MYYKYLYSILFSIFWCLSIYSQDTLGNKSINIKDIGVNSAAMRLSKSLNQNKSDEEVAKEYENLAKELIRNKEYTKAQEYLEKAKALYSKKKKKNEIATLSRGIARIQESQNNFSEAISNYDEASKNSTDVTFKQINSNDANRLRNNSNPSIQSNYIQQNIQLAEQQNLSDEKTESYKQLAEINLQNNQKDLALTNLEKALENSKDKTTETAIKRQMAQVYILDNQIDKAIKINTELIKNVQKDNDIKTEIEQLQILSSIYLNNNKESESIDLLKKAYNLATKKGQTYEAKRILEQLVTIYQNKKEYTKSIELYQTFLSNLEQLIKSDSSLVDSKLFEISESKIVQLEKERILQDELLSKKNTITYFLITLLIIIAIFSIFIIKTLYSIKKKNKKIALQSLRREMNPHFIFNSLNSVNQFIAQNNELEANKYLTSYSKLMRNIMENSNKDFIKLTQELEQLKEYLGLEELRFQDKFSYFIEVDENLDTDATYIPNMLIQPNLENAIWHGLRYKEEKGFLRLSVKQFNDKIIVTIEDNGIGLKQSTDSKTENQKLHKSRGMTNTKDRILLLNKLYSVSIELKIFEKRKPKTGVIVKLIFPKNIKIKNN
ncbi:histidine kinase [Apibacter sp.]|uniref:tetratricopeptide repeat-containing sensor histidine kinase n=1 Tax=Apibacter sp. TaxID=2023709 RepID=UPI0025F4C22A|nr:histidine kinase [Apibacter sp.]MCT6869891.1 histidine kinase [Apibacter sp.]